MGMHPEGRDRMMKERRRGQRPGEPRGRVGADRVERGEAEVEEAGEAHHDVETERQEDPHADLLDDEVHPERTRARSSAEKITMASATTHQNDPRRLLATRQSSGSGQARRPPPGG